MEPAEALADCLRGVAETLRHHRDLGFREITLSRDPFSEPPLPGPSFSDPSFSDPPSSDPVEALRVQEQARAGCKLCKLCKSRSTIVFGVGNPRARLMVVGEGPGEEEDKQGIPFVGRAGQLLTNMIKAMGLSRDDVYIANVVKCRPPGNRTPERDECDTCGPFLMRQVAAIRPKVIVALGATAAKYLLDINDSMGNLRGQWYDFTPPASATGGTPIEPIKLAVTYHPAYLLRDPRQKGEAWKDLQLVMKELGLKPPAKS
jgi:DNA polymerase